MKQLKFLDLAKKILLEEKKPLTGKQIWQISKEKGYDKLVATEGKTPGNTIHAAIYVDMRDNQDAFEFVRVSERPTKFYLQQLVEESDLNAIRQEAEKEIEEVSKTKYSEKDLHALLSYYVYRYMRVLTKTIRHEISSKKAYAQWVHPDLVGVYFPIGEWEDEVLEFNKITGSQSMTLYSFEMKKEVNFTNIRESFFQAVSNSSWANEGYLVAAEIEEEEEFLSEIKRLSTSFGIGIIKLNTEDPDSSEVLFPAKFKPELDWDTINKIASINGDFKELIKRIKNDLVSKEIIKERYDKILKLDDLKRIYN